MEGASRRDAASQRPQWLLAEPFLKDLTTRSRSTIGSRLPSLAKAMTRFATSYTAGSLRSTNPSS
jgi:hypothetical protein